MLVVGDDCPMKISNTCLLVQLYIKKPVSVQMFPRVGASPSERVAQGAHGPLDPSFSVPVPSFPISQLGQPLSCVGCSTTLRPP